MTSAENSALVAVDIGGTKTAIAIVTAAGKILASDCFPTQVALGPETLCDMVADTFSCLRRQLGDSDLIGLGISAPGPLSSRTGCFLNPPNMPGWHGFPIAEALQDRLQLEPQLMNDANAAAFAEFKFGAGMGMDTMVFLTMSTGMGAGLIIGGQLHEGQDDMAGEVGHTLVALDGPVGFGRRGSLEGFCSGPGLSQLAVTKLTQALHTQVDSLLFRSRKDWRLIDAVDVGLAADAGDAVAQSCLVECGEKLGHFCADLVDLLNPDAIVLGTIGRIHADLIIPAARVEIDRIAHPTSAMRVKILPASLGDQLPYLAGAAAFLARQ